MRRKLKVKLLVFLLGAAAVLAVSVHLLHAAQVRRNASSFLHQAEQAEADGRPDRVLKFLKQYLAYVPNDLDVLARYGLALDKLADSEDARARVVDILERVLWSRPDHHDIRRRLIHIVMALGRFADAGRHLQALQKSFPQDGELDRLLGECEEAARRYPRAAECYARSIKHDPKGMSSYVLLARLLRVRLDQPKKADAVLDNMVKANAVSSRAYLVRARAYLTRHEQLLGQPLPKRTPNPLEVAAKDITRALELAPDDADGLLAASDLALARAHSATEGAAERCFDQARQHLERGIHLHRKDERLYRSLAQVELQAGKREAAIRCLQRALDVFPSSGPQHAGLLWGVADLLLQKRKPDASNTREARDIIARLNKRGFPRAKLDYLRARILAREGSWLEAARLLEGARLHMGRSAKGAFLARRADLALGECYRQLGQADSQYAAFRRAAPADPTDPLWLPAYAGMADALTTLEKFEDALELFRALAPRLPEVRLDIARLLVLHTARQPKDQQNWQEVEKALAEAARSAPDNPQLAVLRAQVLLTRFPEQPERARNLLRAARAKDPKKVALVVALAALAEREDKSAAVLSILNEAKRELGDRVELRLAYARYWAKRGRAEASRGLTDLARNRERFSPGEQRQLLRGLAEAHDRAGDPAAAERLWRQLAAEQPDDLTIRLTLFDHALRAGQEKAMQRVLEDIQRIDGPDGTLADYGKACILLWRAGKGDRSGLVKARSLLTGLANRRPGWSRVPLCLARVEELDRDRSAALQQYLHAIDLGERDAVVIRRAVELLYERGRYFEADQVVRKLPEVALVGDLQRTAAVVSLRSHDYDRALTLAERAVAGQSKDYRDYIWLGQILSAVPKRRAEAEKVLRRAVELAPRIPDSWLALIHHLAITDRNKAEEAIREAEGKLPKDKATLALARSYEAFGDADRAGKFYQAALAARPDDPEVLRGIAAFQIRTGQLSRAQPHLRRLIGLKHKSAADGVWAQLTLAFVLALGGDFQQSRGALGLVAEAEGIDAPTRQRAQARVLAAQKDPANRRKAIDILEGLDRGMHLTADDQFLLAQLYQSVGQWSKARARMLTLLAANRENRLYLGHFCQSLLRHKELDQAPFWIAKLEKMEPGTLRTIELKALLLSQQGKAAEGVTLVREYAKGKDGQIPPAAELLYAAGLIERLGEVPAAEDLYRAYVSRAKRSDALLVLAQYLGRSNRPAEALDLCDRAARSCAPEAVACASLAILSTPTATNDQRRRVEDWLDAALRKAPENAVLQVHLGVLRSFRGRYSEAEALYRRAMQGDHRGVRVMAMNNLAWLLALTSNRTAEALELVKGAMELAGPEPSLLDTRALVYLKRGEGQLAKRDLGAALLATPSASRYFHLAQAQLLTKNRAAAVAAFRKARELGLRTERLDPLERPVYHRLATELAR
jgi:predicted Zn-dependent protease